MFHYPEKHLLGLAVFLFILGCIASFVFFILVVMTGNSWFLLGVVFSLLGGWLIGVLLSGFADLITYAAISSQKATRAASELESLNKKVDIISKKIN